jgi:hypothetical protein
MALRFKGKPTPGFEPGDPFITSESDLSPAVLCRAL